MSERTLCLTIWEQPRGKGRPRTTRTGHVYTDQKTRKWEQKIRDCWVSQVGQTVPLGVPVTVVVQFCMQIPDSWTKSKKQMANTDKIKPIGKPDLDNMIKSVLDGLNGVAYADDSQIVQIRATELYSQVPNVKIGVIYDA